MRKTFALQVSDKNLVGLKHYGYDCHVPEQILISSYLVFGHGGPYIINAQYFKDTFEYNGENAEIEASISNQTLIITSGNKLLHDGEKITLQN